jgi:hypothetical protein
MNWRRFDWRKKALADGAFATLCSGGNHYWGVFAMDALADDFLSDDSVLTIFLILVQVMHGWANSGSWKLAQMGTMWATVRMWEAS